MTDFECRFACIGVCVCVCVVLWYACAGMHNYIQRYAYFVCVFPPTGLSYIKLYISGQCLGV